MSCLANKQSIAEWDRKLDGAPERFKKLSRDDNTNAIKYDLEKKWRNDENKRKTNVLQISLTAMKMRLSRMR